MSESYEEAKMNLRTGFKDILGRIFIRTFIRKFIRELIRHNVMSKRSLGIEPPGPEFGWPEGSKKALKPVHL